TIHDMFEMERAEAAVLREVIYALYHAVFIVAEDMTILFANHASEALLREQHVVHSLSGGFELRLRKAVMRLFSPDRNLMLWRR
ncbi:hypothetical protein ACC724_39105, partial [Rhizobium ruizarguesonis]